LLQKISESRARVGKFAGAKRRECGLEVADFRRIGLELLAIDRDFDRLQLAQACVQRLRHVFLLALQIGHVAHQLFVLPTQLGLVGTQRLDLRLQIEQAAPLLFVVARQLIDALA
jgi:hypothetical protein